MATSASAFAAELVEELAAMRPACRSTRVLDKTDQMCGQPGGAATTSCEYGHVHTTVVCPSCLAAAKKECWTCNHVHGRRVPVTIMTEVSG